MDVMGKKIYKINYKNWRDPFTKFLLSIQSMFIIRMPEIVVIVLLILNVFYTSPIWNLFRLALLFFLYSNLAFRSITEIDVIRKRLKRIMLVALFYLWMRVAISTLIDVYKSFNPTLSTTSTAFVLVDLLGISWGEKLILVIEFFLVEYLSTTYFDAKFKIICQKLIEKKLIRSNLIALGISYDYNEKKLMDFIQGYSERLELENDINKLNHIIESWNKGRTIHEFSKNSKNSDEAANELIETKNKENIQKLTQTSSTKAQIIFYVYQMLRYLKNEFLFMNVLDLYDFILQRNEQIINEKTIKLRSYLSGEYDIIARNVNHIKKTYATYIESASKRQYSTINLEDVLKKGIPKKDPKDLMNIGPNPDDEQIRPSFMNMRSRSRQRIGFRPQTSYDKGGSKFDRYNYKVVNLDTESAHKFNNLKAGDELDTDEYRKIKFKVIFRLMFEVFLSKFHVI